ncbi:MAG: hypothetical protein AMXMBFR64_59570 [Myxococcales bacterium]
MNDASIGDIRLWLNALYAPADAVTAKKATEIDPASTLAVLRSTHTGAVYEGRIATFRADIASLPDALTSQKRPFTDELATADLTHDAWIDCIGLLLRAIQRAPSTPEVVRARVDNLTARLALSPTLKTASYADQAAAAPTYGKALASHGAELAELPVAWEGDGRTMADWVSGLGTAADAVGSLLAARSNALTETVSPEDQKRAFVIRTKTLTTLRSCRAVLADEIAVNEALPRNLERLVFGYLDDLSDDRAARRAGKAKKVAPEGPGGGDETV